MTIAPHIFQRVIIFPHRDETAQNTIENGLLGLWVLISVAVSFLLVYKILAKIASISLKKKDKNKL